MKDINRQLRFITSLQGSDSSSSILFVQPLQKKTLAGKWHRFRKPRNLPTNSVET